MDSDEIYKTLGARIKSKRKQLGKTQVEIAEMLGVSRASLANIETGRQKVLVHTLFGLARVLQIGVVHLLPDDQAPADAPAELAFSKELTPAQQASLAKMLINDEKRKAAR